MKLIPVIDYWSGNVVHGVGGRRDEYQPLRSRLTESTRPLDVAAAIQARYQNDRFYLADLNGIVDRRPDWDLYDSLATTGTRWLVDAGLRTLAEAARLSAKHAYIDIVVGLETTPSPERLREWVTTLSASLVFSLDLKGGVPLAPPGWAGLDAWECLGRAVAAGCRRVILLDLADVGGRTGGSTESLCRRSRDAFYDLAELIVGGGIRTVEDLRRFASAGADGALIATAIHDGSLAPSALKDLRNGASSAP